MRRNWTDPTVLAWMLTACGIAFVGWVGWQFWQRHSETEGQRLTRLKCRASDTFLALE